MGMLCPRLKFARQLLARSMQLIASCDHGADEFGDTLPGVTLPGVDFLLGSVASSKCIQWQTSIRMPTALYSLQFTTNRYTEFYVKYMFTVWRKILAV